MSPKILYRYEAYVDFHPNGDRYVSVILKEYEVIRETKCYYICKLTPFSKEKKVKKKAKVPYAWPTKELAMKFLKERIKKRRLHCMQEIERIQALYKEILGIGLDDSLYVGKVIV